MKNDDYCIVELTPLKDLCVETFQFCKEMGRFVLTDQNKIIAYGTVERVIYQSNLQTKLIINLTKNNDLYFNIK